MKRHKLLFLFPGLLLALFLSACSKKDDDQPNDRCQLEPHPGNCLAAFRRYYYDKKEKKCKEFIRGGCGGVVPFETLEECKACE